MLKGLVIHTDGTKCLKWFEEPYWKNMQQVLCGPVEIVNPIMAKRLGVFKTGDCFVCNEEGLLRGLEFNLAGSILYGGEIVGNIIIFSQIVKPHDVEWVSITDALLERLKKVFNWEGDIDERT